MFTRGCFVVGGSWGHVIPVGLAETCARRRVSSTSRRIFAEGDTVDAESSISDVMPLFGHEVPTIWLLMQQALIAVSVDLNHTLFLEKGADWMLWREPIPCSTMVESVITQEHLLQLREIKQVP